MENKEEKFHKEKFHVVIYKGNTIITEDSIIEFGGIMIHGCRISNQENTVTFLNPLDNKFITISGIERFNPIEILIIDYGKPVEYEWVLLDNGCIWKASKFDIEYCTFNSAITKKIIASTNRDITPDIWIDGCFIDKFIKSFNEKAPIKSVSLKVHHVQLTFSKKDNDYFKLILTRDDKSVKFFKDEIELADANRLRDSILNLLGGFDNPVMRRKLNDFQKEAIEIAKKDVEWFHDNFA